MWKQKFFGNRQKWEGARHSCTLLTKGLPRSAHCSFPIAPFSNFIPVFLSEYYKKCYYLGKCLREKMATGEIRLNCNICWEFSHFLSVKFTEIAPGRIHFVTEVFISYQQLKEEKQTFGAGSGMCSELLNSTRLLTEIGASRPHSLFMGRGFIFVFIACGTCLFSCHLNRGGIIENIVSLVWPVKWNRVWAIIVPKTNISEPESLRTFF